MSVVQSVNFDQCLRGVSLRKVLSTDGPKVKATIANAFLSLSDSINTRQKLTAPMATIAANEFVKKYPFETMEDVLNFVRLCLIGEIFDASKVFRIGVPDIFEWFSIYLDKKAEFRERIHQKKKGGATLPDSRSLDGSPTPNFVSAKDPKIQKQLQEFKNRMRKLRTEQSSSRPDTPRISFENQIETFIKELSEMPDYKLKELIERAQLRIIEYKPYVEHINREADERGYPSSLRVNQLGQ